MVALLPDYLKDLTRFAYHTGWRRKEIFYIAVGGYSGGHDSSEARSCQK